MSDLMREEFEAAYKQEAERQGKAFDRSVLTRQASGDYVIGLVQAAWWAWQASRECLVIERPEDFTDGGSPSARILVSHHREIIGRWVESIEQSGAKVES